MSWNGSNRNINSTHQEEILLQLIKVDLWSGCNEGCKVINITNIEGTGAARCSRKGVCCCPISLIMGKEVVHSAKAAAGKVCHLLWMFPLIAPSQNALTHTFWDLGCHSRDGSQCSTDYNMYHHQSTPCNYHEVRPASENGWVWHSRMLYKQDQIYFQEIIVQTFMQTTVVYIIDWTRNPQRQGTESHGHANFVDTWDRVQFVTWTKVPT